MNFTYLTQPPKKWTLEQPKLKEWVEQKFEGLCVLNLFAGKTRLLLKEIRVDISNEFNPDFVMDAYEYVCSLPNNALDAVLLDPPYNLRKSREKYGGKYIGSFTKIKNVLKDKLRDGGLVIIMGYDSVGMANCRGFEKIEVCLVCHNGDHNDTICLLEKKRDL